MTSTAVQEAPEVEATEVVEKVSAPVDAVAEAAKGESKATVADQYASPGEARAWDELVLTREDVYPVPAEARAALGM